MRPYPEPDEPGVVAHGVMARSAKSFLADIEALLVEFDLPTTLAPTVTDLVDVSGWSIREGIARLDQVIGAHPGAAAGGTQNG